MTTTTDEAVEVLATWEIEMPLTQRVSEGDTKAIVDMRPIDEFAADLKVETVPEPEPFSMITHMIEVKKEDRDRTKEEIRNLKSYPLTDPYPDGTVLIWHHIDRDWGDSHHAAVRDDDRWYVAGQFHHLEWDEMVTKCFVHTHQSEVEVVLPPSV